MNRGLAKDRSDSQAGEIDLTPMLDVVFILLIFFIVTAVFIKEAGIEVNKPDGSTSSPTTQEIILIAISPVGEIWMDKERVDIRHVRSRIEQRRAESPNASVVIQGDKKASNEYVIAIMEAARDAGVLKVAIAAEK